MRILITGAAGFIGMHCAKILLDRGDRVIGVDNLNDYYDVSLKEARLSRLTSHENFKFIKCGIEDRDALAAVFSQEKPDRVIHLAAQAGVRYSLTNPHAYIDANVMGFTNILEGCRHNGISHLVYASSSSVYGGNTSMPFSEHDNIDHPVSLYAATKKANELMAHSYSHLYQLPTTGLRFFTVYGPWGRPDMALYIFAQAILEGHPIKLFNSGNMRRSFTFVDDVVEPIFRLLNRRPAGDSAWDSNAPTSSSSTAPFQLLNIGGGEVVELKYFVELIEQNLGQEAVKELLPMQPGDIPATSVDTTKLEQSTSFSPRVTIEEGIRQFCDWFKAYHSV